MNSQNVQHFSISLGATLDRTELCISHTLLFRHKTIIRSIDYPILIVERQCSDSIKMGDHRPTATVECIQSDRRFDGFDDYAPDSSTPSPSASKGG